MNEHRSTNQRYRAQEAERLMFLIDRDGMEGTQAFARQTITQYKQALKGSMRREFRRPLINSLCVLRRFVRDRTHTV